ISFLCSRSSSYLVRLDSQLLTATLLAVAVLVRQYVGAQVPARKLATNSYSGGRIAFNALFMRNSENSDNRAGYRYQQTH
ncbi:hypothetical protein PFISCL1PPCAC_11689, partial [Pristionchus fissidentatus]